MRSRQIVVLPGGLTIERVAPGLFEVTLASPDGVSSGLLGMWDLQQLVDERARPPRQLVPPRYKH